MRAAAKCPTCGARVARPPVPPLRYRIKGAMFKRIFATVAEREFYSQILRANGVEIVVETRGRKPKTPKGKA